MTNTITNFEAFNTNKFDVLSMGDAENINSVLFHYESMYDQDTFMNKINLFYYHCTRNIHVHFNSTLAEHPEHIIYFIAHAMYLKSKKTSKTFESFKAALNENTISLIEIPMDFNSFIKKYLNYNSYFIELLLRKKLNSVNHQIGLGPVSKDNNYDLNTVNIPDRLTHVTPLLVMNKNVNTLILDQSNNMKTISRNLNINKTTGTLVFKIPSNVKVHKNDNFTVRINPSKIFTLIVTEDTVNKKYRFSIVNAKKSLIYVDIDSSNNIDNLIVFIKYDIFNMSIKVMSLDNVLLISEKSEIIEILTPIDWSTLKINNDFLDNINGYCNILTYPIITTEDEDNYISSELY